MHARHWIIVVCDEDCKVKRGSKMACTLTKFMTLIALLSFSPFFLSVVGFEHIFDRVHLSQRPVKWTSVNEIKLQKFVVECIHLQST